MTWPERIETLCQHYGGNTAVSQRLGVGYATVSRWRNGRFTPHSRPVIHAIEALETQMAEEVTEWEL